MKQKNVKLNIVLNIVRTLSTIVFPVIAFAYASRVLAPNNIGIINFGLSFVNYFSLIASLGITTYAIRECAKVRENRDNLSLISSQLFSINFYMTLLSYTFLGLSLLIFRSLDEYRNIILIDCTIILFTTIGADWLNQAEEDFTYITLRTVFFQLLMLVAVLVFVKKPEDFYIYAIITASSTVLINIANFFYRRRYCSIRILSPKKLNIKKHIMPITFMFVMVLSQTIFSNADITMLGLMNSNVEVGYYSTALKIEVLVSQLVSSIVFVVLPKLSILFGEGDYKKINRKLSKILTLFLTLGIPCFIGIEIISEEIIMAIGGSEFAGSVIPLRILALSFLLSLVGGSFLGNVIFLSSGNEKKYMVICLIATLVNVVANAFLIPKYGAIAAAGTTAFCAFLVLMLLIVTCDRRIKIRLRARSVISIIVAGALLAGYVLGIKYLIGSNYILILVLSVPIGAIIYFLTLYLFKHELVIEGFDYVKQKLHIGVNPNKKAIKFEKIFSNYKKIAQKCVKKHKYEKAMAAINICSLLLYEFNQKYVDDDLEELIVVVSNEFKKNYDLSHFSPTKKVLFYDGFSIPHRGVAEIYLNGLIKNNYEIVYVINKTDNNGFQSDIAKKFGDKITVEKVEYNYKGYVSHCKELIDVILKHQPSSMFFYTTPFDPAGCVAFAVFDGLTKRYLIDLTDHAYWLGKSCNDYFCGSREMSASNQVYGRGIPKEKCIKLGVNLIYDEKKAEGNFPFDLEKEKYVFSGGSLYKTLGDENNTYYKIVEHILDNHSNVYFLYAGEGDDTELKKIVAHYPSRAFHIFERPDFYYMILHSTLYLNTYPMFGGMMMKYAACAGVLPITLKHDNDSDGLLLNQKELKIEYDSYEKLVEDVDKLLDDDEYRKQRETLLKGSVITEERFVNNLRGTIENQKTDYDHKFERIDTSKFIKEYYERFDMKKVMNNAINRKNIVLLSSKPTLIIYCIKKVFLKVWRKKI